MLGKSNEGRLGPAYLEMPREPLFASFALSFCIVLFCKNVINNSEPDLIWSEASHMFVLVKQKLCANMPKEGDHQQLNV